MPKTEVRLSPPPIMGGPPILDIWILIDGVEKFAEHFVAIKDEKYNWTGDATQSSIETKIINPHAERYDRIMESCEKKIRTVAEKVPDDAEWRIEYNFRHAALRLSEIMPMKYSFYTLKPSKKS